MINPQWLELPMSQMNFHGPKDVRATEVQLYADMKAQVSLHICAQSDEGLFFTELLDTE